MVNLLRQNKDIDKLSKLLQNRPDNFLRAEIKKEGGDRSKGSITETDMMSVSVDRRIKWTQDKR